MGLALAIAPASVIGCTTQTISAIETVRPGRSTTAGRLQSRPTQPTTTGSPGLHPLNLDSQRDGFIYVPPNYRVSQPAPLLLMLHGAGVDAEGALRIVQPLTDAFNLIVLAVDSRSRI